MCVIIIHESSITRNRHVAQQYSQECFSMGTLNHRVLHSCNSQNMDKRTSSFMIIPPKPNFIRTMQNTSCCNLQPTFLQNSRGDLTPLIATWLHPYIYTSKTNWNFPNENEIARKNWMGEQTIGKENVTMDFKYLFNYSYSTKNLCPRSKALR
jgi:hypothetical protein